MRALDAAKVKKQRRRLAWVKRVELRARLSAERGRSWSDADASHVELKAASSPARLAGMAALAKRTESRRMKQLVHPGCSARQPASRGTASCAWLAMMSQLDCCSRGPKRYAC